MKHLINYNTTLPKLVRQLRKMDYQTLMKMLRVECRDARYGCDSMYSAIDDTTHFIMDYERHISVDLTPVSWGWIAKVQWGEEEATIIKENKHETV